MRIERLSMNLTKISALIAGVFFLFATSIATHAATDVTGSIELLKSRLYTDRSAGTRYLDVSLHNTGTEALSSPIIAVIDDISNPSVTIGNQDGITDDGKPYFLYDSLIQGDQLLPDETSGKKRWIFKNANRVRFSYKVKIFTEPSDSEPPSIKITNPVDQSVISNPIPFVTIVYKDNGSGIDKSSLSILINGAESKSLFHVTEAGATCQLTDPLNPGLNGISVSIKDLAGNSASIDSNLTIATSSQPIRYIFSLQNNDWIFASPGDGTCTGYLKGEDLGITDNSDILGLSQVLPQGDFYFSMAGSGGILKSPGDGTNNVFYTNAKLGLNNESQTTSLHTDITGNFFFSLRGKPNIYNSSGDSSNTSFMENYLLGLEDIDPINCLHIGYDNTIYFCGDEGEIVSQSTGGSTKTQFLSAAELGVPGSEINAFAFLPETVPPVISISQPGDGTFLNTTTPNITINFSDEDSGINSATFSAEINGRDMTSAFAVTESGASYQVPQDSPLKVGSNTLKAKIKDKVGNEAIVTSNFSIGILRAIPGATPVSGTAPLTVHFTTDGTDPAGTIVVFRWDFNGDGTFDTYDTVAQDYNHTFNNTGTYNATLHVWSSTGEKASAIIPIKVDNNPPVANADIKPSNGEIPLTVQMTGSGSDNDGSIVLYEWDFDGDGTYDWSSTATGNTNYTYKEVGTFNAIFRVTDNSGLTDTAHATTTVVRTGPPGSPTVSATASPTSGNAPLNVNLNGNATDPDNDIALYEWDFNNDGVYDWSSTTSASTSSTYNEAGTHTASLRVTDSTGLTAVDQVLITVNIQTNLSITNDTVGFITENSNTEIASAAASSYYNSSYIPRNAIDGNTGTYWQSANEYNLNKSYFEVNFKRPQKLSGFMVRWYSTSYMYTNVQIDIFDGDGKNIHSQETPLTGTNSQISFPQVENSMKLRITAISKSNSNWTLIREFEVDSVPMVQGNPEEPEPTGTNINTSISAGAKVSILIKDAEGNTSRTLVNNKYRTLGAYTDYWDCKDDSGIVVNDGAYYAVMQYIIDDQVKTLDLTNTSGGTRYSFPTGNGCNRRDAMSKSKFAPYKDEFSPITFRLCKASEVTVFLGPLWQGGSTTRVRTVLNRKVLPAGEHTVYWDGLDDQGNIAHPPSGDKLILGMWRYSMPNNGIYMTGGKPEITKVTTEPNYFNPLSNTCLENGNSVNVSYTVSEDVASVELKVVSLSTSNLVRIVNLYNVDAGENNIFWDGRNMNGDFVEAGDYQLIITATDTAGNESMLTTGNLVRLTY